MTSIRDDGAVVHARTSECQRLLAVNSLNMLVKLTPLLLRVLTAVTPERVHEHMGDSDPRDDRVTPAQRPGDVRAQMLCDRPLVDGRSINATLPSRKKLEKPQFHSLLLHQLGKYLSPG